MKLPDISGLEVTLQIGGKDLKEYEEKDKGNGDGGAGHQWDDGKDEGDGKNARITATSFVEAVPGANFAVACRAASPCPWDGDAVEVQVHLNGTLAEAAIDEGTPTILDRSNARLAGRSLYRKFMFADPSTSDVHSGTPHPNLVRNKQCADDDPLTLEPNKKLANVGTVRVELHRVPVLDDIDLVKGTGDVRASEDIEAPEDIEVPEDVVPFEDAVKGPAVSGRPTLGKPMMVAAAAPRGDAVKRNVPMPEKPFAIFEFKCQLRTFKHPRPVHISARRLSPVTLQERDPDMDTAKEDQDRFEKKRRRKRDGNSTVDNEHGDVEVNGQRKRQRMSNDSEAGED